MKVFEIREYDLLWILWALVFMLGGLSFWLWVRVDDRLPFAKSIRTMIPAFIMATISVGLYIQSIHMDHNRDLYLDLMIYDAATMFVVLVTYILNRPKKGGE